MITARIILLILAFIGTATLFTLLGDFLCNMSEKQKTYNKNIILLRKNETRLQKLEYAIAVVEDKIEKIDNEVRKRIQRKKYNI